MTRIFPSADAALADLLRDDLTLCVGGFGLCGIDVATCAGFKFP